MRTLQKIAQTWGSLAENMSCTFVEMIFVCRLKQWDLLTYSLWNKIRREITPFFITWTQYQMQVLVQNPLSAGMFLFLNKVSYLWRCSGLRLLGRPVERRMFCWLFLKSVWGDMKWKCYWTWTHMADWHISSKRSSTKTKVKTLFTKRRKEKPSLVSNPTTV